MASPERIWAKQSDSLRKHCPLCNPAVSLAGICPNDGRKPLHGQNVNTETFSQRRRGAVQCDGMLHRPSPTLTGIFKLHHGC